jgi:hypothetical protein
MATVIYFMCAFTSAACAFLLLRGYSHTRVKLLFWSGLCFLSLAIANIVLVVDLVFIPDISFWWPRNVLTLLGIWILLYGLVWESR